ncbi:MAG: c-type cytochrome [Cellvibrionaceae bacterium]
MKRPLKVVTITICFLFLVNCDNFNSSQASKASFDFHKITLNSKENTQRWYFSEQAKRGELTFSNNCAACHGRNAEATPHWKTPDANFNYPPPPLNGSAHAWHHPLSVLGSTIYHGGAPVGGQMPSFKDSLSESEIIDVIAYFQSYWSDDIYNRWLEIEKSSRQQ